jgi:hypothetical protein
VKIFGKASSEYRGVSWKSYKWYVQIAVNGCKYYGGYFENEMDAAKAYNRLAISLLGKNAKLNEV